ncbi:MAG: hypothetical protein ACK5XS_05255 [Armatimonadota bacterium]|nr:hypothetical protein [Fimbriimonadaceae bacterium]
MFNARNGAGFHELPIKPLKKSPILHLMEAREGLVVAIFPYNQAYELLMRCLNHADADTPEFAAALETLAESIREAIRESDPESQHVYDLAA